MSIFTVMTILGLVLSFLGSPLATQQLEIHFLNVGQGDAAIVQEGGHTAIIDAGPSGINGFLTTLHIDTIDLVVASHPHADHIGGMAPQKRPTMPHFCPIRAAGGP
jgi:competence protein ComEC